MDGSNVNRLYRISRRASAIVAAGIVFQTAGCQINTTDIAATLATSVINNLIASFVFSAFSLAP